MIQKARATYTRLYDKPTSNRREKNHFNLYDKYIFQMVHIKQIQLNEKYNWYQIDNKPLGLGSSLPPGTILG